MSLSLGKPLTDGVLNIETECSTLNNGPVRPLKEVSTHLDHRLTYVHCGARDRVRLRLPGLPPEPRRKL